jgi:hypothetical protein
VRRAFLAGKDEHTGHDYSHRREWIRKRMEILSAVFGVDTLVYSIMSNRMHLVLRARPDVVETWSDREAALRWLKLFPGRRIDEHLAQPTKIDVNSLAGDPLRMKEVRARLSDSSWFMRSLSEPIARMANKQDKCTGRFWEGRFKAQRITDEAGLLACAVYVDLSPVRAAMADSPESSTTSGHTSAYDRMAGSVRGKKAESAALDIAPVSREQAAEETKTQTPAQRKQAVARRKMAKASQRLPVDSWLAPLTLNERGRPGVKPSKSKVRASDRGFLAMSLKDYLKLLAWTGRQGQLEKRGKIPLHLSPIVEQIGIEPEMWADLVWNFEHYFGKCPAAGSPKSLQADAARRGKSWSPGQSALREFFV